ncbi:response regulator [Methylocystis sp. H62]|uniref:response regulator n=1 Tax=Methylocystis sp. H62 TaxID=2785789 RepID=UPI0018C257E1|nr:response regulator [Methylocystis sp. H62]MBG0792051.1 response regulator [Methylocystis sp. H62]
MRVLLVEDEGLVALLLEEMLLNLGHEVTGRAQCIEEALQVAATADYGLAILDINLNGVASFPAAEIVRNRSIPIVFATGYRHSAIPLLFEGAVCLQKPFSKVELGSAIAAALTPSRRSV